MTDLCKLAAKYGTDKTHYTPVYDLLLRSRRTAKLNVLEIGIGTPEAMKHVPGYKPGASLRMWRDYFPYSEIYGVDKDEAVLFQESRIHTSKADQSNAAQLEAVIKSIGVSLDLIVDDGSHNPTHQALGVTTLLPYLAKGGLYIVEDVNNFAELQQLLPVASIWINYGNPAARCAVIRG